MAKVRECRWISEGIGPTYLFISPGVHECWHEPDQYERHARRLRRLVQHLSTLQLTVVRIFPNAFQCNRYRLPCLIRLNDGQSSPSLWKP